MDRPFQPARYLRLLARRWPLLIIPPLVALIAAIAINFLTPTRYIATATMIAPNAQLAWRWENKISDLADPRAPWRGDVMALLSTRELAERALTKVQSQLTHPIDADALLEATRVTPGRGDLFTIAVTAASADDAARLANALAASLPEAVANYFGGDVESNQKALDTAMAEYRKWDDKLLDFRGRTGIGIGFGGDLATARGDELYGAQSTIKEELTLKNSARASLQTAIDRIDITLEAIKNASPPLSIALLDIPNLDTYGLSYANLRDLASSDKPALLKTLTDLRAAMAADLDKLAVNTIARQFVESKYTQEMENILQVRGVWLESVTALERRGVELQMKGIVEGSRVQIVDDAIPPEQPSQPRWILNLALALAGGLLLGLLLAIVAVYWRDAEIS